MQAFLLRVLALAPLNHALNVLKHWRVSVQIVQVKNNFSAKPLAQLLQRFGQDKDRRRLGTRHLSVTVCRRERGWSDVEFERLERDSTLSPSHSRPPPSRRAAQ